MPWKTYDKQKTYNAWERNIVGMSSSSYHALDTWIAQYRLQARHISDMLLSVYALPFCLNNDQTFKLER